MSNSRYDELSSMDKGDLILYTILLEQEFNITMELEDIYKWIREVANEE